MPSTIHVFDRYCDDAKNNVVGAAVTIDKAPVTAQSPRTPVTAQSPRTLANGMATIATEKLADGPYVLRITPAYTSQLPVGPDVAEDLPNGVTRIYRSLDVDITVRGGRIEAVSLAPGQEGNGAVGAGLNPVRVRLQPVFYRGLGEYQMVRKYQNISVIVIHQTAGGGTMHGSFEEFLRINPTNNLPVGSPHYIVSAEAKPQVVKISRDNHPAGHAGGRNTSWHGKADVNIFSIGIENSHKTGTGWPRAQIDRLMRLLEQLLRAYPSIPRHGIVGHTDVLPFDRECPGLDFDWVLLEREGLGMVPRAGVSLEFAYGGFFRLQPQGQLQMGDQDAKRIWGGGNPWGNSLAGDLAQVAGHDVGSSARNLSAARAALASVVHGKPIHELQTDLRDIGYNVTVNGLFDKLTWHAVKMFQKHFFAGSRRGLVSDRDQDGARGKVDRITAEYIKRVRP